MGRGAQTEERVRFVYGFMRRSKSSTGMRRAHLFSGASGGRRSASAAVDGATAIPHLNEDIGFFFSHVNRFLKFLQLHRFTSPIGSIFRHEAMRPPKST